MSASRQHFGLVAFVSLSAKHCRDEYCLKMRHRVEKRGEGFAVSGFQLLDEVLHVFADELLCGGGFRLLLSEAALHGG